MSYKKSEQQSHKSFHKTFSLLRATPRVPIRSRQFVGEILRIADAEDLCRGQVNGNARGDRAHRRTGRAAWLSYPALGIFGPCRRAKSSGQLIGM